MDCGARKTCIMSQACHLRNRSNIRLFRIEFPRVKIKDEGATFFQYLSNTCAKKSIGKNAKITSASPRQMTPGYDQRRYQNFMQAAVPFKEPFAFYIRRNRCIAIMKHRRKQA